MAAFCGFLSLLSAVGVAPGNYDDGLILFVYVRHFLQSGRFYWNVEDGNVDGFTSALDLFAKSGAAVILPGDIIRSSFLLNVGLHIACGALAACFALLMYRRVGGGLLAFIGACAGAIAAATNPAIAAGSAFLLETPLYVFTVLVALIVLAVATPQRATGRVALAVSWLLVALARPEGAPLVAIFACAYLIWHIRETKLSIVSQPIALFAIAYLIYLGWHTFTFGHWAPNTYYAKLSDRRWNEIKDGIDYLRDFALQPRGKIVLGFCLGSPLGILLPWRTAAARWIFAAIAAACLVSFAIVIWSGGDCYLGDRFLATPVTLALMSATVAAIGLRSFYALLPVFTLLAVVFYQPGFSRALLRHKLAVLPKFSVSAKTFESHKTVAQKLEQAGFRVAIQNNFQMYKYFSDVTRVRDATGLNDKQVAHMPWPAQNLWGKEGWNLLLPERPEVVSYGFRIWSDTPMSAYSTAQIAKTPALYYSFAGYPLPAGQLAGYRSAAVYDDRSRYLNVFIREDCVERARAAGILVSNQ